MQAQAVPIDRILSGITQENHQCSCIDGGSFQRYKHIYTAPLQPSLHLARAARSSLAPQCEERARRKTRAQPWETERKCLCCTPHPASNITSGISLDLLVFFRSVSLQHVSASSYFPPLARPPATAGTPPMQQKRLDVHASLDRLRAELVGWPRGGRGSTEDERRTVHSDLELMAGRNDGRGSGRRGSRLDYRWRAGEQASGQARPNGSSRALLVCGSPFSALHLNLVLRLNFSARQQRTTRTFLYSSKIRKSYWTRTIARTSPTTQ